MNSAAPHAREDKNDDAELINDTFMEGFDAEAIALKDNIFKEKANAALGKFAAESEEVPLSKPIGGVLDGERALASDATVEALLERARGSLLKLSYDPFIQEVTSCCDAPKTREDPENAFNAKATRSREKAGSNPIALERCTPAVAEQVEEFNGGPLRPSIAEAVGLGTEMEFVFD
ncbi:unnamed protein product [Prorocentrum cordatum]|uniref:Uncharacterized protein n=1 Tax=Prorocentrum cordatum TaxID=2364126 RepID=A0ABN9XLG7_9DINO|nr:unnamed protein product [Polarella glacialis]